MDMPKKSRITLGLLKGKSINTSVPSFRFNATAEEIEELYISDHEQQNETSVMKASSDVESSPCKLNKLSKRSTSINVPNNGSSSSPPNDPWRFFNEIKGKITKSVEGKITEYKSRGDLGAEGSPNKRKGNKDHDSPSLSESEELSESSLSRTCGIVSTTEGVEMSSDDEETNSLSDKREKTLDGGEKNGKASVENAHKESQRKVTVVINKETKGDLKVSAGFLEELRNINMGLELEVESGIDALSQIDNVQIKDEDIFIYPVSGAQIRKEVLEDRKTTESTVFAPSGFVDLRIPKNPPPPTSRLSNQRFYLIGFVILLAYFVLPFSSYLYGFVTGNVLMFGACFLYIRTLSIHDDDDLDESSKPLVIESLERYVKVPSVEEERPQVKYQGWANEYPDKYDPCTYHVSQTQSVYMKLQGNMLRISNTRSKIPKRAIYNESHHRMVFVRHRIYNLLGAQVLLLPKGLTKIRHWSKKYPICIILNKDQLCYDMPVSKQKSDEEVKDIETPPQLFSKLIEDSLNLETDNAYEDSKDDLDVTAFDGTDEIYEEFLDDECPYFDSVEVQENNWATLADSGDNQTCIYIFTRTDRDKEHWFRRFTIATHKVCDNEVAEEEERPSLRQQYLKIMSPLLQPIQSGGTYSEYMSQGMNRRDSKNSSTDGEDATNNASIDRIESSWLNALLYRMVFDCQRSETILAKIHERVARKFGSIKLPNFIESLRMTELTLGTTSPKVCKTGKPHIDEWGLWIDFDISYEGSIVLTVTTKLNLMKLQQRDDPTLLQSQSQLSKSPIYHSDVDDSAESSSDDDSHSTTTTTSGGAIPADSAAAKSKRFMKMMDRFTESKFFQRATENKYIKKAIQGVSNTEVGLKVELKRLNGCLVLNIPPPPSDRVWLGFRSDPMPKLQLNAQPVVGEKNWNFMKVSNWIERKLSKEFLKICLLPNMEDIQLPFMDQDLPR